MTADRKQNHRRRYSFRCRLCRATRGTAPESIATKKNRRIEVGPFATFYFENYDTMWLQVHEMLHIEKGGAAQIAGELEAYNPLIPQGSRTDRHLDAGDRGSEAPRNANCFVLPGSRKASRWSSKAKRIAATPTEYDDRTTPDGKTSSVHWVRFIFTPEQIAKFKSSEGRAMSAVSHPAYGHMAVIPPAVRAELAKDFI